MISTETTRIVAEAVERFGSPKAAAAAWGVHPAFVRAVIRGERRPGRVISQALGLPAPANRRGGSRYRGSWIEGQELRPRPRPGSRLKSGPEPPDVVTASPAAVIAPVVASGAWAGCGTPSEQARAEEWRRAAEIRFSRMPKAESGRPPRLRPVGYRRMVREHLARERVIFGGLSSLLEQIRAREQAGAEAEAESREAS
jgi:hypothetical protein